MTCYLCQAEAVTRCYLCGALVCEQHGGKDDVCTRCCTGITAGDPRPDRISATPVAQKQPHGWWQPQQAEEYHPPACYECQGLSRGVCRNCHCTYCHEHAGPSGLCKACGRSAQLGTYIFVGILAAMLLFYLAHRFFG